MEENKGTFEGFDSTEQVKEQDGLNEQQTNAFAGYSYTFESSNQSPQGSAPNNSNGGNNGGNKHFGIGTLIICILLSVVISAATSAAVVIGMQKDADNGLTADNSSASINQNGSETEIGNDSSTSSTVISIEGNIESLVEAVYDKSADSVVGIMATASVQGWFGDSESKGEGSGVIYSADGYIITNYHVVENVIENKSTNSIIEVFFPSKPEEAVDAKVVGYNVSADLAVLKVEKTGLPAIEMADSDSVKVGQYAIAIGCPGGIEFLGSVSYGIVSGLNRSITIDSIGEMELIQTDAAINPGNSGGALLNSSGQLIGINSSKLIDESFEGMGFAIPSNTVVEVVEDIIDNKDNPSPYIGIEIYTYSSSYLNKYGLPAGAAVKSVVDNGPADQANIRSGDIITEFASVTINEYDEFIDALNNCTPGTKVTAKIYRNGRYYTTTVTIGSNNSR